MFTHKLHAGAPFPEIKVKLLSGDEVTLAETSADRNWKLVVVYRGKHCPLCTRYLNELEQHHSELNDNGVDIIAVSGDSKDQLASHMEKLDISFQVAYGLSLTQMQALGLYISIPRSEQETDHNFAEPGLFVVNQGGTIQVVDISNNPFARPDLASLVSGIHWIRKPENNYPIRGTFR